MPPTIALIAHDVTPSNVLGQLASVLAVRGYTVVSHLAAADDKKRPSQKMVEETVKNASAVVIGLSSKKNCYAETWAIHYAVTYGKPFGFFSDNYGGHNKAHFQPFLGRATFAFTVSSKEADAVKKMCPGVKAFPTGTPHWAPYFLPASRDEARAIVNAKPDDFVIVVGGTKDQEHNLTFFDATIAAAFQVPRARVVLSLHPGDTNDREPYRERVATGLKCSLGQDAIMVVEGKNMIDRLLPGADVLINGRSAFQHALARQKPIIEYYAPGHSQAWLKGETGSDRSYFHGSGGAIDIYDGNVQKLADALKAIQDNPKLLCEKQRELISPITAEEALGNMHAAIRQVLEKEAGIAA